METAWGTAPCLGRSPGDPGLLPELARKALSPCPQSHNTEQRPALGPASSRPEQAGHLGTLRRSLWTQTHPGSQTIFRRLRAVSRGPWVSSYLCLNRQLMLLDGNLPAGEDGPMGPVPREVARQDPGWAGLLVR